uniref:(California timema) hypothetical protein n=1 Tax=Timema californicum TaxID=61474 RepID=A0A7R9J6M8_TIMCA|nr:unnamed protein product [Timema californicum]
MPAADHEIRAAAESLLNSSSSFHQRPSPTQLSHSMSINTRPDYLLPADLITGSRQSGRMSVVRRFFCLLVTFDLLFTSLMWLIALMMAAISRFTVLLLFYGVLSINHWCVIAWSIASQPVFQVLLILVSFIISWGEVWFLDFKVLPQEQQANDFLQASPLYAESERAPLLGNYLQGLTRHEDYNESVGNFYSPMDSPEGSDDERDPSGHKGEERTHHNKPLLSQEDQYRQDGIEALEVSWQMLNSADWNPPSTPSAGTAPEDPPPSPPVTPNKKERNKKLLKDLNPCRILLEDLESHDEAWPFLLPVNTKQFPTYRKIIKTPNGPQHHQEEAAGLNVGADVSSSYKSREDFVSDVRQIFNNCETFNEDDSPVGKAGHSMRLFFENRWGELNGGQPKPASSPL